MKRIIAILLGVCLAGSSFAQTLNVNQGSVTYAIPATQMGEAVVSGNAITIGKKTYNTDDITTITVDDSAVNDNSVAVNYNGSSAQVVIAGNIAHLVSAKVTGAHVTLLQSADATDEITYTLSGSSSDGSLYMNGKLKATFVLNGLSLTNPDSCAINIQDGKRIALVLAEGKTNTFTDGIKVADDGSDAHKACFYVDGHPEFSGAGTLTINGKVKHGFCSDEYCLVKASAGTITVASAPSDGFHIGQYFMQKGGTINITSTGDGVDVGAKKDATAEFNGQVFLNGGSLTINANGAASKGVKCDASMEITDGVVNVTCKGDAYYDTAEADITSSAALKCTGTFTMTGGNVTLLATGKGGKLVNSDGSVTISGGKISGAACGDMYVYSTELDTKAHAIKTDGDINIAGGEVYVAASEDDGKAFKTDFKLNITGGTLMGIGGKKSAAYSGSTQGSKTYTGVNVKSGATVSYDGVSFTVPSEYSNTDAKVIVSKPGL